MQKNLNVIMKYKKHKIGELIRKYIQPSTIILFFILVLGFLLRFKGIRTRDIWYDEALDVLQASKSLVQIIHDVPTPVHYFIVHFFLHFGKTTLILGLPAIIFGLLSIVFAYKVGSKISGVVLGLVLAFLFTISPMNIEFSQQILHYSYFSFFSIVSLYLFIIFISDLGLEKIRWWILLLLLVVNGINVLTHISSFIIIASELIFIFCYLVAQGKLIIKYKYWFLAIAVISIVLGYIILIPGDGYYLKILSGSVSYGSSKPIELGYSLSKQLNTNVLKFDWNFFHAMFAWFGMGPNSFYLYFSLFLLGVISLTRKKPVISALLVFWIVYPFIQLYFVRPNHWFEEKYFIFIIPAYLLFIAEGVIFTSAIISKIISSGMLDPILLRKRFKTALIIILCFIIGALAVNPFFTRTTYGFSLKNPDQVYSWRAVYDYLHENTSDIDRVFVRSNEGLFLDFYFPESKKDTYWFNENYVLNLSQDEYLKFINKDCSNYFVSIPDIQDTYIAGMIDYNKIAKVGGFNIYQVNFKRTNPVEIKSDSQGSWEYYDDFRDGRYLAEASSWNSFSGNYLGNFNLPITYGYYDLSPTSFSEDFIEYKFALPEGSENFLLRPNFSLNKNVVFKVQAYSGGKKLIDYEKRTEDYGYFNPELRLSLPAGSRDLKVRFQYDFDSSVSHNFGENNLKSIWLYNNQRQGVVDYDIAQSDGATKYSYDAELEIAKTHKWLYATIENEQWVQSIDGVLFTLSGQGKKPLTFDFQYKNQMDAASLELKTFTFDNSLEVYSSIDNGANWSHLKTVNNNATAIDNFDLKMIGNNLLIKFICNKAGPTCQVRNLKLQTTGR